MRRTILFKSSRWDSHTKTGYRLGRALSKEYAWSASVDEEMGITGAQIDLFRPI